MSELDNNPATTDVQPSWTTLLSTELLKAELARRQADAERPACGSGHVKENYNTPLHVAALVIILVLSTLACSFPIIVRRFPNLPVPHHFLFLSRHFGTGVLIATAFVHLLPTGFVSLTDPCLPPFWNQGYPAMPGLIAMISVLFVVGIEMFFATRGAGHVHGSDYDGLQEQGGAGPRVHGHGHKNKHSMNTMNTMNGDGRPAHGRTGSWKRFRQEEVGHGDIALRRVSESRENLVAAQSPIAGYDEERDSPDKDGDSDLDLDELDPTADASGLLNGKAVTGGDSPYGNGSIDRHRSDTPNHSHSLTDPSHEHQEQQKALLQCLLLEAGILFHSVFIGMALSVATGTPFIVLLIAISFHQTFEGLALGSRIAAVKLFSPSSPKPWLMALAYGTTTPVGQAIGLLVHNLYDPASQTGLLMVGIMNAISSGLLLFAGLVELLAEDFLSDKSYVSLRGRRRIEACTSVVSGSLLMALVGAWA